MQTQTGTGIITETTHLPSELLERTVTITVYQPSQSTISTVSNLLLFNDGQDLVKMEFDKILAHLVNEGIITAPFCVGIHCGEDRINEYGMAASPDFKGRGAKAGVYTRFILEELLPYLYRQYPLNHIKERAFAGFSLGGLSALDIVWNYPDVFSKAGVFSGSLWWRSKDKTAKEYNEGKDRLMHQQVRKGKYQPGLKFFFECGEADEKEDRNNNGVIDSIDDTIDLMRELLAKGYMEGKDFRYLQLPGGKHDVASWAKAIPEFLQWGWGV